MCLLLLNISASWLYQWTEPEMHRSVSLHTYIHTYSNIQQDCLLKEISFEDYQENLETQIRGGGRRDLFLPILRRQWYPTPVLLPGKSHGWRSLVGCSPWGRKESDMTERLHFHFSLSCIGEGNGSPLQCSGLENPRDGEAWWAAVYGVAQSWT